MGKASPCRLLRSIFRQCSSEELNVHCNSSKSNITLCTFVLQRCVLYNIADEDSASDSTDFMNGKPRVPDPDASAEIVTAYLKNLRTHTNFLRKQYESLWATSAQVVLSASSDDVAVTGIQENVESK